MNDTFCVYMHENKTNKKKYIGITCQKPEKRWMKGYGYTEKGRQPKFANAIKKYGWNNFVHFILCENLNIEQVKELEKFFIEKFDSIHNGYNCTKGGDSYSEGNKIKVNQYDLNGKYIKTWNSLSEIKVDGFGERCSSNVSRVCKLERQQACGYIWRFYKGDTNDIDIKLKKKIKIMFNGELKSLSAIAKELNLSPQTLYKRYKNGFDNEKLLSKNLFDIRKEEKEKNKYAIEKEKIIKKKQLSEKRSKIASRLFSKKVCQYDLQGNFIKEYNSISDARKELKLYHISDVCLGKRKRCGGFIWKFKEI